MHSLRARLIAVLLVLAGAGLLTLAAITYTEQRSFLLTRLDQQAESAAPAVSHVLDEEGLGPAGADSRGAAGGGAGAAGGSPLAGEGAGAQQAPSGGPGPNFNLPPGTYGQRRD